MRYVIIIFVLLSFAVRAEEPSPIDEKIKHQRTKAELQQAVDTARDEESKKAAQRKLKDLAAKEQGKKDLADYKSKVLGNLDAIKEMFAKAEESWKNQKYGEAGLFYSSVVAATAPGAEQMAETSRGRLVEMEDLAKERLKAADDFDLKREYMKEVDELTFVCRELALTKAKDVAFRRLITLKSRPDVSGYVDLAEAEAAEIDGKTEKAKLLYMRIAENPRYEGTLPALKARLKLERIEKSEKSKP